MKFTDKEMQEDWDNIPAETKRKYREEWLLRHPQKPRVLFVKEWLAHKQIASFSLLPLARQVAAKSLASEIQPLPPTQ